MHLAAGRACDVLAFKLEDLLVDIYFHLEKSSKRKETLAKFQREFCGEVKKIVKHVSTRWLSLGKSNNRLLEAWVGILAYFEAELKVIEDRESKRRIAREKKENKVPQPISTKKVPTASSSSKTSHNDKTGNKRSHQTDVNEPVQPLQQHQAKVPKVQEFDLNAFIHTEKEVQDKKKSVEKEKQKEKDLQKEKEKEKAKKKEKEKGKELSYSDSRVTRIVTRMKQPVTKAYCLFLKQAIPLFDGPNTVLQSDAPVIHKLLPTLNEQLEKILLRFLQPEYIERFKKKSRLYEIEYQRSSKQKDDEQLFIGEQCRQFLEAEGSSIDKKTFYENVRSFYLRAVEYMIAKFPYADPVLYHATVADINQRTTAQFESVKYFMVRYPIFLENAGGSGCEVIDKVAEQFLSYHVEELPQAKISKDENENIRNSRMDVKWHEISKMKDGKYQLLSKIMKGILVIFHSNADCERVFSYVTKTATRFRPSLSTQGLSDLTIHKCFMQATEKKCFQQTYTEEFLRKAKSATYVKLSQARKEKEDLNL